MSSSAFGTPRSLLDSVRVGPDVETEEGVLQLRTLVVPVDFSEGSRAALERAAWFARRYDATLHLVHAVPPIPFPAVSELGAPAALTAEMEARSAATLRDWAASLSTQGLRWVEHVSRLRAVDAICALAETESAEWIVMGTHGYTGFEHAFLGSVAEKVLRVAPCPVLTIKRGADAPDGEIRRGLVCTDFSTPAEHAVSTAIELCADLGARLDLVHAAQPLVPFYGELPIREPYLEARRSLARRKVEEVKSQIRGAGIEGTAELIEGEASDTIVEFVRRAAPDLLVLGTRGNTGLKHVALGSVAERVVRQVSCPVLTTK